MSIYKEIIMDHYHHPHNHGLMEDADAQASLMNSTCGDKIKMTLKISDNVIEKVTFDGKGCVISVATASLLTDHVKNMRVDEAMKLTPDDLLELLGTPLSHTRLKCAILPLDALKQAISPQKK